MTNLNINNIIKKLERLEDNIIIDLFERTYFKTNDIIYSPGGIKIPNFTGSFFDYMLYGTEVLHATAGRYDNPEEKPFFTNLPPTLIKRRKSPYYIQDTDINFNFKIKKAYFEALQKICEKGDDGEYGSTALCDIKCLQDISKRVHLGAFVAESKIKSNILEYSVLIKNRDREKIIKKLRNIEDEEEILKRIREKGERYNINPEFIVEFYRDKIIPMTIEVEVKYLFS